MLSVDCLLLDPLPGSHRVHHSESGARDGHPRCTQLLAVVHCVRRAAVRPVTVYGHNGAPLGGRPGAPHTPPPLAGYCRVDPSVILLLESPLDSSFLHPASPDKSTLDMAPWRDEQVQTEFLPQNHQAWLLWQTHRIHMDISMRSVYHQLLGDLPVHNEGVKPFPDETTSGPQPPPPPPHTKDPECKEL
jgi:hypothetical protein